MAPSFRTLTLVAAVVPRAALGAQILGTIYSTNDCAQGSTQSFERLSESLEYCLRVVFGATGSSLKYTCADKDSDSLEVSVYWSNSNCEGTADESTQNVGQGECIGYDDGGEPGKTVSTSITQFNCANDGKSSGGDPCFARDSTHACVVDSSATDPHDAYAQCFNGAAPTTARLALMATLKAGDLVLTHGPALTRVVVNQHVKPVTSELLTLRHSTGEVAVTADHVIFVDGAFAPARNARVGSLLSDGNQVLQITHHRGAVVNPITASGTILAAAAEGSPVLAATGNEWIAEVMLSPYAQYTLSFALARAFPATVQAYYDDHLEAFFAWAVPHLRDAKARLPTAAVTAAVVAADVGLAAGLALFALTRATGAALALAAVGGAVAVRARALHK